MENDVQAGNWSWNCNQLNRTNIRLNVKKTKLWNAQANAISDHSDVSVNLHRLILHQVGQPIQQTDKKKYSI